MYDVYNIINFFSPSLSGEPLHVLKGQLPRTSVDREPIHVLPELSNRVDRFLRDKRESTDLIIDEAGHHLELHGTVVAKVHVLKEIAVG